MELVMRMKFWFALGGVALLAVILFLLGPCSLMAENAEDYEALQGRVDRLGRYARRKVKNEKWVEQQNKIQNNMERQLRQVQEELLSRDSLLEEHLKDPDTGAPGPLGYGRFPAAYAQAMGKLRKKLENSVPKITTSSPLVRKQLGNRWLPQHILHDYEKQVQVQRAVVKAIADLNKEADVVPIFHSFRFQEKPERFLTPAHAQYFHTIPFQLKVAMEFEFYPLFLERLMLIPMGPEMTSVKMRRYTEGKDSGAARSGRDGGSRGTGSKETKRDTNEKEIPHDLIFVTLTGYIPDYIKQNEEESEDKSSSGNRDRGRRRR